ncbi:phosphatidylcholine:ceramide cholinephosphotransferase 2-like isoform X2 [Brienomyrus brachyistius]|uniref:phosphatidylcholine:ceramide cholinephosphotransferase 2-like isoform X2 n=1 Tax=Brienomyrus brachyistius TaxID=42636 RepID=UPI0020B2C308|nr:phosphatidylcholine:ceramide cholinephosphotransferase 2-like isoform X2 [Brienomyrus brachyistius]
MARSQLPVTTAPPNGHVDIHTEDGISQLPNGVSGEIPSTDGDNGTPERAPQICPCRGLCHGFCQAIRKHRDYITISLSDPQSEQLPLEWWKTAVAFIYALFNLLLTTVMITVVHERVPAKETCAPLPDKFFDYFDRVSWAFSVTEINGMILVSLWFGHWLLLRYKAIVGRRFFFLMGTLYLYRCITMYITTLPAPSMFMSCAPKLYGDSQAKVHRILQLVSGAGLSITGSHIMCGDFLYSGHTVILTLTYLFIKEYSPRSLCWVWYRRLCLLLSVSGILGILLGHEHYSVDVVVAYFVTSRLFWWYHAMAKDQTQNLSNRYLRNTWWDPVFSFLEKNVGASVPCTFCLPISWPPSCLKNSCKRYSMVQSTRDE